MVTKGSEYTLRWRAKNVEKYGAYQAAYTEANREELRAKSRARWRASNKETENLKQRERRKRTRATPNGWLKLSLRSAKARCIEANLEFNITAADITIPGVCPITKKPFAFGGGNYDRSAPSLDRIRPKEGYVKGNVRVISQYANTLRQDCIDPDIFQALADDARALRNV